MMPRTPPRVGRIAKRAGGSAASTPPGGLSHAERGLLYAQDVVEGRIKACKWVRLACQRHLDDLRKASRGDFAYTFDSDAGSKVCKFIELLPHTKGKWAAKSELIKLEPWQCFILTCVFGWLRKSNGKRRFRKVTILVPRKNGKSALSAGVGLYMLCADGEHGAEVYSGATSEKQAWEVFGPARLMARGTPALTSYYKIEVNARNLNILSKGSKFEPLIGKPGDGASPSLAIVDEFHEHDTPELRDTMLTGMGAREHPLLWVITTAGSNLVGPCHDDVLTCRKILDGVLEDDEQFYIEYTIDDGDDWTSQDALVKANPNYGVSVDDEFLLSRQREAIRNTREQGRFKTKHLNLWVNARNASFNMQNWALCQRPELTMEQCKNRRAWVALDLASKQDIAAMQVLFEPVNECFATFGLYYLPEETAEDPVNDHYKSWAIQDPPSVILTEGNMIDFERIEEDLDEILRTYDVQEVTFDPHQATMLISRLMSKGVNVTEFMQTSANYTEPFKETVALVDAHRLHHNCGPSHPMTWMMSNVTHREDAKSSWFPRKERPESKIDGPIALIMAMGRYMATEAAAPPPVSPWENPGYRMTR